MVVQMVIRNELDDYFMRPYYIEGIGDIYPVNIFDYERFRTLAGKYIVQGISTLHNIYKVPKNTNVLDYFVSMGLKMDKELEYLEKVQSYIPQSKEEEIKVNELNELYQKYKSGNILIYSIYELEELFSMVFKKEIKFNCSIDNPIEGYFFCDKDSKILINKNNFNILRDVIMWQNILFEPPTSPTKIGNDLIRQTIEVEFGKNNNSGSLASICSIVATNSGISDEQLKKYTYYRLMYDFSIINRQHGNMFSFMLRSQGCAEAVISDLSQEVDLHKNPYDSIFRRHKHDQGNIK
jgi:hypothetical protein